MDYSDKASYELDGKELLNSLLDIELRKVPCLKSFMPLLNKYGVHGTDAAAFLVEFSALLPRIIEEGLEAHTEE